jgi:hypothetical protein
VRFLRPNGSWDQSIDGFEETQRRQSFHPEALALSAG